jgi:hypothetical protein
MNELRLLRIVTTSLYHEIGILQVLFSSGGRRGGLAKHAVAAIIEVKPERTPMIDRMDEETLRAMLEAMPIETTVIDAHDEVIGWNKHEKRLFHRPTSSMGLNFRDCHPRESLPKVEQIVSEMRSGAREKARFWIDLEVTPGAPKHKILIEFYALRDSKGHYLGCMECTQDVQDIMELQGQKRLLD